MKKRTSQFIQHLTKAWRAFVELVILMCGDHRQEGRERTLQLGCLTITTGFMCVILNSSSVINGVNHVTNGIRGWVTVSSTIATLFGGGATIWLWAKRKSRKAPNDKTEIHLVNLEGSLKDEIIFIIKSIEPRVSLWANKDRLYFKCTTQSEPFIRVFFNASQLTTDIYCDIDLKTVPVNFATKFPDARLVAHSRFGTVLIPIHGFQKLTQYKELFHLAILTSQQKS